MCSRRIKGFTLIEMIVVIAIIVMALLLAIPAIRSLTGSRSIASAENAIATASVAARTEAISRQKVCGVLFYLDMDLVKCALVQQVDRDDSTDPVGVDVVYLDLIPDRDPLTLPVGIRLRTMKDMLPVRQAGQPSPFIDYCSGGFLGFNEPVGTQTAAPTGVTQVLPGGVILYNAQGALISKSCGFRFTIPLQLNPDGSVKVKRHTSQLGLLVYGSAADGQFPVNWPNKPGTASAGSIPYYPSSVGVVLYDRDTFAGQSGNAGNYSDWDNNQNQPDVDSWLNNNCTPVFINRYSGVIMRAE